jgi:sialic acid synthase SpsE
MAAELRVGTRTIASAGRPYVIAEAGVHHRNSLELAKRLVMEAAIAGADAVKFQTYSADRLATTWAPLYWDDAASGSQHDVFASRSLLTRDDYAELFAYAAEIGIAFLSTPFDDDAAEMLAELGMPAFKTASADITDLPLLRRIAGFGRPVLLSTGASSFEEVRAAVDAIEALDCPVAVLHCSLAYPTPAAAANLGRIPALAAAFPDHVVGYSDHTQPAETTLTCPLAVSLGARIVEKHFTLNRALEGDDHYHAVDPQGLADLVRDCATAATMSAYLGETTEQEQAARTYARRSIVAARAIAAGTVLTRDDVDFKRPGTGMSPGRLDEVLGRTAAADIGADELIAPELLGPQG